MTKGPEEAFQICHKARAQGIKQVLRRESTKRNPYLSDTAKMAVSVFLSEKHIWSTMISWECLYLFPEKYVEPLDSAR